MPKLLTAPLTIERGDVTLKLSVSGRYTKYTRATRFDPEIGDEIEDIEAQVTEVTIGKTSRSFPFEPLELEGDELTLAEAALREAMQDD
jgi:hypothetical protein